MVWWDGVVKMFSRWLLVCRDVMWDWRKGMRIKGVVWNGRVEEVVGDLYIWGLLWCVRHMID